MLHRPLSALSLLSLSLSHSVTHSLTHSQLLLLSVGVFDMDQLHFSVNFLAPLAKTWRAVLIATRKQFDAIS